jgi:flagellar export protein FliJ
MQRFTFKLTSVRSLREQREREAKEALARELALEAERERSAAEAAARVARARDGVASAAGATTSGPELLAHQAFVERTERERLAADAESAAQHVRVEASRRSLESAAREREAMDRLYERERRAHRQEVARAEDRLRDDLATARRLRGLGRVV